MNVIVAGAVLVAAVLIGLGAYTWAPIFAEKTSSEEDEIRTAYRTSPATRIRFLWKKENWKRCFVLCGGAALCAWAAFEISTAQVSLLDLLCGAFTAMLLLSVMVIDGETHLIPNVLVLIGFGIGTILLFLQYWVNRDLFIGILLNRILGLVCCAVLFYVLSRLTKDGMGMGDVKLIACIGWMLGISTTLFVVLFALLLCSVVSIFLLIAKKKNKEYRLPFGPFLFYGYIILLLIRY